MANKNTAAGKAPAKQAQGVKAPEQKDKLPAIRAQIDRLTDYEGSKVRAFASANIGEAYAIHGIRVMDSDRCLYVSMPSRSYQKDGKTEYTEVFHPVSAEARVQLTGSVLQAYEQKLQEEMTEENTMGMTGTEPPHTQSM